MQWIRSTIVVPLIAAILICVQDFVMSDMVTMTSPETDRVVLDTLEKHLLDMFGLSRRPKPRQVHIPPIMRELYEHQFSMNQEEDGGAHEMYEANTVRSFLQEDSIDVTPGSAETFLFFNVTHLHPDEELKAAELRVLTHLSNDSYLNPEAIRVEVHDVLSPAAGRGEPRTVLLDTRLVRRRRRSSWETLDVSPALHRWRRSEQDNHGLLVRLLDQDSSVALEDSHMKHVRLRRSTRGDRSATEEPVLVTYTDDGKDKEKRRKRDRRRRTTKNSKKKSKRRKHSRCRRHTLNVLFKEIGWDDWIVAPPSYDAFLCQGECPSHLSDHLNATNHAIVQTLVNSVNSEAVPKPCCVPTELTPIAMLYVDEFDKVTLKNYQDMIVNACGCR